MFYGLLVQLSLGHSVQATMQDGVRIYFGEQYHDQFDTQAYLKTRYSTLSFKSTLFTSHLPHLYDVYQTLGTVNKCLKILDVGAGPSISNVISAAPYASEIVLAEYTENNRTELQHWLDRDPEAFDWTTFIKHVVVDVEGGEEKDIAVREDKIRSSIKAVVPCDITKDPLLPQEYMEQYDVVQSMLCICAAVQTKDEYVVVFKRLSQFIKPNGKLILYLVEEACNKPGRYPVGNMWFKWTGATKEFVIESLVAAGFNDISRVSTEMVSAPGYQQMPALYTATYAL